MRKYLTLMMITTVMSIHAVAQLNTSFGNNGFVNTNFLSGMASSSDIIYDIQVLNDGKIVAIGRTSSQRWDFAFGRYLSDGSLDISFGSSLSPKGTAFFGQSKDDEALQGIVLSDGKILAVGYSVNASTLDKDLVLIRVKTDGTLDASFGSLGYITYPSSSLGLLNNSDLTGIALGLQNTGKIVVAGIYYNDMVSRNVFVSRFNKDGSLDNTFGTNGTFTHKAGDEVWTTDMKLGSDGSIYICGYVIQTGENNKPFILKLTADGSIDNTFGNNGLLTLSLPKNASFRQLVFDNASGNILAVGNSDGKFLVANVTTSGMLETSFADSGYTLISVDDSIKVNDLTTSDQSIGVDNNGKIILTADVIDLKENKGKIAVIKLSGNGTVEKKIDYDFNTTLPVLIYDLEVLPDNDFLVCGCYPVGYFCDFFLAKFKSDLTVSMVNHKSPEFLVYPNPSNGTFTIHTTYPGLFELTDISGRVLKTYRINDLMEINESLPAGMYFVRDRENGQIQKLFIYFTGK